MIKRTHLCKYMYKQLFAIIATEKDLKENTIRKPGIIVNVVNLQMLETL